MADLRFSTAAASLFTHAGNNRAPVISTVLDKLPDLVLTLLRGLLAEYALTIPLKGFISAFLAHGITDGLGVASSTFQPHKDFLCIPPRVF